MRLLSFKLVTAAASLAASLKLIYSLKDPAAPLNGLQLSAITLIVILFLVVSGLDVQDYLKSKVKVLKSTWKIRNFMFELISKGNRVCIFTRDMSWASDKAMENMLLSKAREDNLTLVMPAPTSLSELLRKHDATVHYYGTAAPTTLSRFTITNVGRADATVTIGRTENSHSHKIDEFSDKDGHPAFALAQDLASILRAIKPSSDVGLQTVVKIPEMGSPGE